PGGGLQLARAMEPLGLELSMLDEIGRMQQQGLIEEPGLAKLLCCKVANALEEQVAGDLRLLELEQRLASKLAQQIEELDVVPPASQHLHRRLEGEATLED